MIDTNLNELTDRPNINTDSQHTLQYCTTVPSTKSPAGRRSHAVYTYLAVWTRGQV